MTHTVGFENEMQSTGECNGPMKSRRLVSKYKTKEVYLVIMDLFAMEEVRDV